MKRLLFSGGVFALALASSGWAADDNSNRPLDAIPWVFVGTAAQCGGVAGSRIATAQWMIGMGLPDNGTSPNQPGSASSDPHIGLLLSKNGPTPDCSASGATISGLSNKGYVVTELGFDYRNGGHCGAGAPRFNVTAADGNTYFLGCIYGVQTPAPQDPQWTRVRFSAAGGTVYPASGSAPPFVFGSTVVKSIEIVHDEGTDTPSPSDPTGAGLAVLDNIDVNGTLITSGNTNANTSGSNQK